MQRLKRAIKKMAAIGTGIAMLGATVTSAVALDLSEYPSPFVSAEGIYDESTSIVVGSKAAASDTLGAIQIATNLQYMAKTPVASGGGGVSVVGGTTEDIPIGIGLANTNVGLDWQLQDNDISSFQDTKVTFKGKSYNIHDELDLSTTSPSIETSLTSSDDDYETAIVMEVARDGIKYYYVFDEAINISKATSTDPLEIKFLGKTLKITNVDSSGKKFTAYVGNEYFMKVGDTVTVDGKKVTLSNVGIGGAIVIDVDGTIETIAADATKTVNGIEISNDETFYEDTKSERAASLVIGVDAKETYADGDAYVGEDENNPNWVWNMENLGLEDASTVVGVTDSGNAGPILGIENDFVMNDDSDNPPQVGDCLDLPNIYASICFDSLTVADDDYATYIIEYESDSDLSEVNSLYTSTPTIYIHTAVTEGLLLDNSAFTSGGSDLNATYGNTDKKTNKMWLSTANLSSSASWASNLNSNNITVMYEDSDGKVRIFGKLNNTVGATVGAQFAQINFGDTTGANINISIAGIGALTMMNLTLSPEGDNANELTSASDLIIMQFSTATDGNFSGMTTLSSADTADLYWGTYGGTASAALGQKDEDHRTKYGIIIRDPKNHGASDEVVLEIPEDQVQANVVVKGTSTTVTGGATTYIPADITIDTRLDTEITDKTAHNLILVGGPCAGGGFPFAAAIMSCDDFRNTFKSGEALVKLVSNGDKVALLVAGYDAIDTRMAAKVLANYQDYKLELTEQVITGSLAAPMIKVS